MILVLHLSPPRPTRRNASAAISSAAAGSKVTSRHAPPLGALPVERFEPGRSATTLSYPARRLSAYRLGRDFGKCRNPDLHDSLLASPYLAVVQDAVVNTEPTSDVEILFRKDGVRLWRALLAFAGDREVASDAVAEAFAQVLGRGDAVRTPERWVWRAAFKIARGELKERGRRQTLPNDQSYDMSDSPTDLLVALGKLSPKQRAATILHFYAGYSTKEVAEILGSSAATVRVHLSQGRKRLRSLLEDDDG
jgi:RNA polymerase sigma-70 factor, ECF subfamily